MIYALTNKNTSEPRYVGKTKRKLTTRLCGHIHEATKEKLSDPKCKWIRKLGKNNVDIKLLEKNAENEDEAELWWMDYLEYLGCDLLNVIRYKVGGTNGRILSKNEQKELLKEYKDPSIRVSKLCEKYDITNGTLSRIRRDWGVERVSRRPKNFIDFDDEKIDYIVKQYEENYLTERELSEELNVSRQAVRRVLEEQGVDFHSRADYIEAGKIDPPNEGKKIEDDVKKQVLRVYAETNNLSKACRQADVEENYDMIWNRINNGKWEVPH